jgi:glycosyltransferase involved in cell wall biosynthesis
MKLLYIADGRSPTALNWISYFIQAQHEVHLVSTYPCAAVEGVASQYVVPVALSNFYGQAASAQRGKMSWLRKLLPVRMRTAMRRMAVPLTFSQAAARLQGIIERVQPELVHAMRIPYEGVLATDSLKRISDSHPNGKRYPLIVSVWGNDFTLHAESTRSMAERTRQVLNSCDALHTDCQRDQRLAMEWGFGASKPRIVLPGGGGIQLDIFYPPDENLPGNGPLRIINPRGYRAYVQNDTFFQSIPSVLEKHPETQFVCPGMSDEGQAQGWVAELGIADKVDLLPNQTRLEMARLFRQARITLSITTHDGTPNTLLEAMACGCFPIAGDIESLREWITPGENGLLVQPEDVEGLAQAILKAIEQPEMRQRAKVRNLALVGERAEYGKCMALAEEFYQNLIYLPKIKSDFGR